MQPELKRLAQLLAGHEGADGVTGLGLGDAVILRRNRPSDIEGTLYRPLLCMVLQGAKTVTAGTLSVHCPAGHGILVSHHLPVLSRITEASPVEPYLAVVLPLDLGIMRSFYEQMPDIDEVPESAAALLSCPTEHDLRDALARFLALTQDPASASLLGPILLKEIHARLLMSPHGSILRRFLRRDDPSNHVSRAIASIRASIHEPVSVASLAEHAGMSKSTFHAHFKAVTGQSPGQYQKDIRLLEGRRRVIESSDAISSVAFDVGYDSAAQFSRDYARKFGRPPRDDRNRGRSAMREAGGIR